MLTREEAQQLVLKLLKRRQGLREHFVEEERSIERPFGWLFFVTASGPSMTAQPQPVSLRLIIVNRHVEQVIESSIDYTPVRFIEIYESLLAESKAIGEAWCQTLSFPLGWERFGKSLAEKAKEMGLYEIK